jgi:hypothetical protein
VDAGACRLRLVRDDGELLAEEGVQKGGLTRIRATDDRDETRAKCHSSYYALLAVWWWLERLCYLLGRVDFFEGVREKLFKNLSKAYRQIVIPTNGRP